MLEIQLAYYLDDEEVLDFNETGTSGDTFINILPSSPDDAIGIFSEGGPDPSPKFIEDQRDIQFMVRGTQDPRPAFNTAQDIYDTLHGKSQFTTSDSTQVIGIQGVQSGPIHIGRDDNGRHRYSLNFRVEFENADSDNRSEK